MTVSRLLTRQPCPPSSVGPHPLVFPLICTALLCLGVFKVPFLAPTLCRQGQKEAEGRQPWVEGGPTPSFSGHFLGLPALVVAISVGFTKAKGYSTMN